MSDHQPKGFSEEIQRAFGPRTARGIAIDRRQGPPVLLREVHPDGGFGRTIRCSPGRIVCLPATSAFEPFRLALLGKAKDQTVQMRYDAHALEPSEINIAGRAEYFWKQTTVKGIVRVAGVPEPLQPTLLRLLGLESSVEQSPAQLGASAMRRLAIACSLFTRSRLLVYDAPFDELEERWVDKLALLILEGVIRDDRIVVVTGAKVVPESWRDSSAVDLYSEDGFVAAKEEAAASRLRELTQNSRRQEERRAAFVTRPQLIPPRGRPDERIAAESIPNPHTEALSSSDSREAVSMEPRRVEQGKLTKVTGVHRMSRRPWMMKLKSFLHRLRG